MNSILEQIYATILPSAPFVIAAYALVWLALLVYVVFVTVRLKRTEAQVTALEEALAHRQADETASVLKKD